MPTPFTRNSTKKGAFIWKKADVLKDIYQKQKQKTKKTPVNEDSCLSNEFHCPGLTNQKERKIWCNQKKGETY